MKPFREGLYAPQRISPDMERLKCRQISVITADWLPFYHQQPHPSAAPERCGEQLTVEMPGQLISNDIDVWQTGSVTGWELGACLSLSGSTAGQGALYSGDGELLENLPAVYLYYPKNAGKTKRVKALIIF